MMVWLLSGAGLLPCVLACRPHSAAPPAPPRSAVQVLIQAAPVTNPGQHGEPWPTALTTNQLRGDPVSPDRDPSSLSFPSFSLSLFSSLHFLTATFIDLP